jgi:hypothetical protein
MAGNTASNASLSGAEMVAQPEVWKMNYNYDDR